MSSKNYIADPTYKNRKSKLHYSTRELSYSKNAREPENIAHETKKRLRKYYNIAFSIHAAIHSIRLSSLDNYSGGTPCQASPLAISDLASYLATFAHVQSRTKTVVEQSQSW